MVMGQGNCITVSGVISKQEKELKLRDEDNSVQVDVCKAMSAFQREKWNLFGTELFLVLKNSELSSSLIHEYVTNTFLWLARKYCKFVQPPNIGAHG